MSDALRRQKGFSLPETLLALVLLIATVTALAGYQRGLANGFMPQPVPSAVARCVAIQSA
jgi:prepilin peptidase dependent protein C